MVHKLPHLAGGKANIAHKMPDLAIKHGINEVSWQCVISIFHHNLPISQSRRTTHPPSANHVAPRMHVRRGDDERRQQLSAAPDAAPHCCSH